MIQTLGAKLYSKNVFGYCSVDLVSFPDPEDKSDNLKERKQKYWALGLKCYLDNATAATIYFDFMMKGQVNKISGEYTISKIDGEESNTQSHILESKTFPPYISKSSIISK